MPGVCRVGDYSTGHGCWPPRTCDTGSTDVFVNGIGAHRSGDHWVTHCCGPACHDGVLYNGSGTVFVNGLSLGRIGDPIDCHDDGDIDEYVRDGSTDVFSEG